MDKLTWDFLQITKRNRDGSFATQAERAKILNKAAQELKQLGYRQMRATSLKAKHIEALVNKWKDEGLANGTIKNRMSHLRWWAEKVNKKAAVSNDNSAYGIENRKYVTNQDKSLRNVQDQLDLIKDPYVKMALKLQEAFGFRREEAIKFIPSYADQGDHLKLKSSWTKGGRERIVPIINQRQRQLINEVHQLVGTGSLIPTEKRYVDQLRLFERETIKVGISNTHGLRHAYAQDRYEQLTGWKSPARGGLNYSELKKEQKEIDKQARLKISQELGHERLQITSVYLGGRQ